jgi:ribonucleoside-diphosphate reductase beta chain
VATLEELAQQGDPGTLETESQAERIKLMGPQQLYELWERQQWLSQDIDFSRDREAWAALSERDRKDVMYGLSGFYLGEERVTTQFSGLVMAYGDEQEAAFLATQQVDEARHMQFFDRFYREVMGYEEDGLTERLEHARREVTAAFEVLFDEHLTDAERRLIENPKDIEAKVDFVTVYHMVIEGTLALTGQEFITGYFEKLGTMPGFVEGFTKVARDEHRHVAYGTWFLKETAGKDPALGERMREKLLELIPVASSVLVPPGVDPSKPWQLFGYSSEEVNAFAFKALTRRLKAIGVPLTSETVAA